MQRRDYVQNGPRKELHVEDFLFRTAPSLAVLEWVQELQLYIRLTQVAKNTSSWP
jgi:hypothetical protein